MALVLFLHGTSSSGKSSIARELQKHHATPLLHVGIDTLYRMLPEHAVGESAFAEQAYHFVMKQGMLERIEVGPYARRLMCATVPMFSLLLSCNNDVIIDEILFADEGRDFLSEYAAAFVGHQAYFIKVDCSLEELERREVQRKNRHRGIARLQYNAIHAHGFAYDLTVHTDQQSPRECADQIIAFIRSHPTPTAFAAIRRA